MELGKCETLFREGGHFQHLEKFFICNSFTGFFKFSLEKQRNSKQVAHFEHAKKATMN